MRIGTIHVFISIVCLSLLFQCSTNDKVVNTPVTPVPTPDYSFVKFDPTSGSPADIAVPNEILRNPVTGFLSLPAFGIPAVDALIGQVNTLRGFSTSAPIRIPFTGLVNEASVNNQTILLVDLVELAQAQAGVAVNPVKELNFSVRLDESGENQVVFGFPVRPLSPGHTHIVIVTQGVTGSPSNLPVESDTFSLLLKGQNPLSGAAAALEPVRQLYDAVVWPAAEGITGVGRVFIPFSFIFTTQPLFETLTEARSRVHAEVPAPVVESATEGAAEVDVLFNLLGFGAVPHEAIGAVYTGSLNAPYYKLDPSGASDSGNGFFQGEGPALTEVSRTDLKFLVMTPHGPGPFPTVIYQHGITSVKETMVALANTANALGFAVIGIDLELHGERARPGMNGSDFINLTNLLNSRDNTRQSVANLFALTHMITSGAGDFTGDGFPELAPVGVTYLGMSLGGIVGAPFITMEPDVAVSTLNVAGGRVPYLLNNSASFGPAIDAGLGAFGLNPGTALYDLFFLFAQTINDDGDGFNYAAHTFSGDLAGGAGTTVLMQEMIGDPVVPNSGTRDLATAMGITQLDALEEVSALPQAEIGAGFVGSGYFQYPTGGHGSLLDPSDGPTAAVQTQVFTFLGSALLGAPTIINPLAGTKRLVEVGIIGPELDLETTEFYFFPNP